MAKKPEDIYKLFSSSDLKIQTPQNQTTSRSSCFPHAFVDTPSAQIIILSSFADKAILFTVSEKISF